MNSNPQHNLSDMKVHFLIPVHINDADLLRKTSTPCQTVAAHLARVVNFISAGQRPSPREAWNRWSAGPTQDAKPADEQRRLPIYAPFCSGSACGSVER